MLSYSLSAWGQGKGEKWCTKVCIGLSLVVVENESHKTSGWALIAVKNDMKARELNHGETECQIDVDGGAKRQKAAVVAENSMGRRVGE